MLKVFKRVTAMLAVTFLAACGGGDDHGPSQSITQIVVAGDNFNALQAAVEKAGLAQTLSSGSYTVFAPTDAAFTATATALGFGSAAAMVEALDPATLTSILTYHVLPGRKPAATLAAEGATQGTAYTFEGSAATLGIDVSNGVKITDEVLTQATVTTANVAATNGVIHVIDKVLVPPGVLNVVQMAQLNPNFSSLVGAVVSAGLVDTLSSPTPALTVFAPVNTAFESIASTVASLTTQELTTVLTYHVLGNQVLAADIPFNSPVPTVAGQDITFNPGTPPTITDTTAQPASIVATDVRASNGVIHVINKVLLPDLQQPG